MAASAPDPIPFADGARVLSPEENALNSNVNNINNSHSFHHSAPVSDVNEKAALAESDLRHNTDGGSALDGSNNVAGNGKVAGNGTKPEAHFDHNEKAFADSHGLIPPDDPNVSQSPVLTEEERLLLGGEAGADARLANPLANLSKKRLIAMGRAFARQNGLEDESETFAKGALLAQDPANYENVAEINEHERSILRREFTHRFSQPGTLYYLVILCSVSAAVQGMDESVISGANLFWPAQFHIPTGAGAPNHKKHEWLQGLVNGAPYLAAAVAGCWLTYPLNHYFGRRGTLFIGAIISFLTCIWGACTDTWWHFFISRFFLGFGIGPKSATTPIFAAECTPPPIRGALVMMWQMWTAFGIAVGYAMDLAFLKVPDHGIRGLNWRLMIGSAGVPAIIMAAQVFLIPESPRWLLSKKRPRDAFNSLCRLRFEKVQAARDLFYMAVLLHEEEQITRGKNLFFELFTVPRNRRATQATSIVMFMQQFCGVNVIVYYVATIFSESGFSNIDALAASFGFGLLNCIGAIPAIFTIDKLGRRKLLLLTFPLMSIFLLLTGFSFWIPADSRARVGIVALGIYLYCIVYSVGEGPVPFTYSAEAHPLYIRELGMAWSTTVCWLFNFIVALTFPSLLTAFKPQGAFGWYAAWNLVGWLLVLFFLPETKGLSLEELDQVFSVPTATHARYFWNEIPIWIRRNILRQKTARSKPLYAWEQPDLAEAKAIKQEIIQKERAGPSNRV